jgi:signal transduction histidine kinase
MGKHEVSNRIRLLIVEDSEDDATLLLHELRRGGYTPASERVDTAEAMAEALARQSWDVIVSDYSMPKFSAPAALAELKKTGLDIPFIVVSGKIGEDTAVAVMKAGAHDYIMKGNLARLLPAIAREIQEAKLRQARRQAEEELRVSREQLRNLSTHLQFVSERERASIAREVHDELGQALTALKMDLRWLSRRLSEEQAPLRAKIDAMSKLIDTTVRSVQRISAELRPAVLDDLGLAAAIEWQAGEFEQRSGITCRAVLPADDMALDRERATAVFRVFQESLTNVARHSGARKVEVTLEKRGGRAVLTVADDGKGIGDERMKSPASLGIIGMRERVAAFGGTLAVAHRAGGGTSVTASIPLGVKGDGHDQGAHRR